MVLRRRSLSPRTIRAIKASVFAAAAIPLIMLIRDGIAGGLGANPIEEITHRTGFWTLTLIMITLSVTPLRKLTGINQLIRLRRMLGLWAYTYACLHFATYIVLDQFFGWSFILEDIAERPYITVGFAAFVLLTPLALTSTRRMIQRLGGARWARLHRLIYVAGVLGVLHFLWLVKADTLVPLRFAAALALLLGFRVVAWIASRRAPSMSQPTPSPTSPASR